MGMGGDGSSKSQTPSMCAREHECARVVCSVGLRCRILILNLSTSVQRTLWESWTVFLTQNHPLLAPDPLVWDPKAVLGCTWKREAEPAWLAAHSQQVAGRNSSQDEPGFGISPGVILGCGITSAPALLKPIAALPLPVW